MHLSDFRIAHVRRIMQDLEKAVYTARVPLTSYKMLESDERGLQNTDTSQWTDYDCKRPWGGFRKRLWFATEFELCDCLAGKPVEFLITTGGEGNWDALNPQIYFYLDGKLEQGLDVNHRTAVITDCARSGEKHKIAMHAYASDNPGFLRLDTELAAVNLDVRKLYYDIRVPFETAILLKEDDSAYIEIMEALNTAINLLDTRKIGSDAFNASVKTAIDYLERNLYGKKRDNTEGLVSIVGHSHIDVAWRWTLGVTHEKTARTFASMLALAKQYPEFIFTASQPELYKYIKEDEPELYQRVKDAIKSGNWDPEGAMYVEADCNLTSGESLARQLLYGKMFYRDEFGHNSRVLWLPDVFGYSAALPQLLKKAGIDYFMTTKINWNEYNKFPHDTFMWQGIDGTEVLTHFIPCIDYEEADKRYFTTYNGMVNSSQVKGSWKRYQDKMLNNEVLFAAGYGDGGGGTAADMLEQARRLAPHLPRVPQTKMSRVIDFFEKLDADTKNSPHLHRWVGELYFEYHRGTYTSMAKNKKYNRQCEFLLEALEKFAAARMVMQNTEYPAALIRKGWDTLMLNQFHDIIPGSSIKEVYDESWEQYENLIAESAPALSGGIKALAGDIGLERDAVVVFNSAGTAADGPVEFDGDAKAVYAASAPDVKLPVQKTASGKSVFYAKNVPANGWEAYYKADGAAASAVNMTAKRVETPLIVVELDDKGYFTSIYDKECGREVLSGLGNMFEVYEDRPYSSDNWEISVYYREKMWPVDSLEEIKVVEQGPSRGVLRVRRSFLDSTIEQDIIFYADTKRIDFVTKIDWKQEDLLVKAAFPVDIFASEATYEVQYGNIKRPTHLNTSWDVARFEVCGHKWADLSEEQYGVALLNDCKFGHDIHDGVIRLTLLKSTCYPNPDADKELHEFTYSIMPHADGWREAEVVKAAYNVNVPFTAVCKAKQDGALAASFSLVSCDAPNAVVEAVKRAEDGTGLICRIYDAYAWRGEITAKVAGNVTAVCETDLMEKPIADIPVNGGAFKFNLKPFEIKTFLIKY